MKLLSRLLSLLRPGSGNGRDSREIDVEPDVESEAAVKGTEAREGGPTAESRDADELAETAPTSDTAEPGAEPTEDRATEPAAGPATEPAAEDRDTGTGAGTTAEKPAEESVEEPTEEPAEEPDKEPRDAAEPEIEGGAEPVDTIKGIGPAYAQRLADAGVETVADLAAADAAEVSEVADIAESRIERWQERARG